MSTVEVDSASRSTQRNSDDNAKINGRVNTRKWKFLGGCTAVCFLVGLVIALVLTLGSWNHSSQGSQNVQPNSTLSVAPANISVFTTAALTLSETTIPVSSTNFEYGFKIGIALTLNISPLNVTISSVTTVVNNQVHGTSMRSRDLTSSLKDVTFTVASCNVQMFSLITSLSILDSLSVNLVKVGCLTSTAQVIAMVVINQVVIFDSNTTNLTTSSPAATPVPQTVYPPVVPSPPPTVAQTPLPTQEPTPSPTQASTLSPTQAPTPSPTPTPTPSPTPEPSYHITRLVGSTEDYGYVDGAAQVSRFNRPSDVVIDSHGTILIADQDNCVIRMISQAEIVSTYVGSSTCVYVDGQGLSAGFIAPRAITIDSNDTIYVGDGNRVRKINSAGDVSTLAGTDWGYLDGQGSLAKFQGVFGIGVDRNGYIYVSSAWRIRMISPSGVVSTLAGKELPGGTDGFGSAASFDSGLRNVIEASSGILYVSESHSIRRMSSDGNVSTSANFYRNVLGLTIDASTQNMYVLTTGTISRFFINDTVIDLVLPTRDQFDSIVFGSSFSWSSGIYARNGVIVFVLGRGHSVFKVTFY